MSVGSVSRSQGGPLLLKALVFAMFAMFAMTTDSVGTVIPEVIREFELGLTAGGSFQYATMSGIAISAIGLGFLADRLGRKVTILIGLVMFGLGSALFAAGHDFLFFTALMFISGLGIGIFKAGALALIGDLSRSTTDHARTMNLIEGFFGVGAIIGPAIVAYLLLVGASWKWVYLVAAVMCGLLILGTATARFPQPIKSADDPVRATDAVRLSGDPASKFFGMALMLYVAAEAAIYVWAPTYLADYSGSWTGPGGLCRIDLFHPARVWPLPGCLAARPVRLDHRNCRLQQCHGVAVLDCSARRARSGDHRAASHWLVHVGTLPHD